MIFTGLRPCSYVVLALLWICNFCLQITFKMNKAFPQQLPLLSTMRIFLSWLCLLHRYRHQHPCSETHFWDRLRHMLFLSIHPFYSIPTCHMLFGVVGGKKQNNNNKKCSWLDNWLQCLRKNSTICKVAYLFSFDALNTLK